MKIGNEQTPLSPNTISRCKVYPALFALGYALCITVLWSGLIPAVSSDLVFPDFLAFHGGAVAAELGQLDAIYRTGIDKTAYRDLIRADKSIPWYYPPTYMIFVFWLPWVPLWVGAVLFLAVTLVVFLFACRAFYFDRSDVWLVLGAPATFINVLHGQNGFLIAALLAFAFQFIAKNDFRAGLVLGLLTIKPHLGLLFPAFLIAHRRWSIILVAIISLTILVVFTTAIYGMSSWVAFLTFNLAAARDDMTNGVLNAAMSSSPFGILAWLEANDLAAMAVQGTTIILLSAITVWLVVRQTPGLIVTAVVSSSILLASPHSFVYDWVIHLIPLLIIWKLVRQTGPLPGELPALLLIYFAPFAALFLGYQDIPIGLAINLVLLWTCLRRAIRLTA